MKDANNSSGVRFEAIDRCWSVLADFDDVAVGIAQVATPFPAVVVGSLRKTAPLARQFL
jgi:hypothetical protein